MICACGPVRPKILRVGVVTHQTLELPAGPDLIPRRLEDSKGIDEEHAAERRKGKVVPHDFGQQHWEVKTVPA